MRDSTTMHEYAHDRNPYRHVAGQPRLRPSWVAFLDILGFQGIAGSPPGDQEAHLGSVIEALGEARANLASEAVSRFSMTDNCGIKFFTDKLDEFALCPRILSKYAWAASYHNFFCTTFLDGMDGAQQFLVPTDKLLQPPRRLDSVYSMEGQRLYRQAELVAKFKHLP